VGSEAEHAEPEDIWSREGNYRGVWWVTGMKAGKSNDYDSGTCWMEKKKDYTVIRGGSASQGEKEKRDEKLPNLTFVRNEGNTNAPHNKEEK